MSNSAFVVPVIESITADFIACNSGTCTGNISTGTLEANSATILGGLSSDSVSTNSVNVAGGVVAGSVQANSALFSGAVTGGSFSGNSLSIIGAAVVGSLDTNSAAVVGGVTANSISVNTASVAIGLTSASVTANNGSFSSSLTISGTPVAKANVSPMVRYFSVNPVTVTNMPSAVNFIYDTPAIVQFADLTNMNEVRFFATQAAAGSSSARMRLNYALGFQTTAENYTEVLSTQGANGGVELDLSTGNTVHDSGWLQLLSFAKGPLYLAVVISGGNGMADPKFGPIMAEFR